MFNEDTSKISSQDAPIAPEDSYLSPTFGFDNFVEDLPITDFPELPMPPQVAMRLIQNELDMDFRNSADLGSYITDQMDPEADELIHRTLGKVFIDKAEYPRTAEIARRIGWIIQNWYNGKPQTNREDGSKLVGAVTIGSSEAIHLGMLAHRRTWQKSWLKRRETITDVDSEGTQGKRYLRDKPIFLFARNAHTCFKKFENYFDSIGIEVDFKKTDNGDGTWSIASYTMDTEFMGAVLNSTIDELQTLDHNNDPAYPSPYSNVYQKIIEACGFDPSDAADQALLETKLVKELVFCSVGVCGSTYTAESDDVGAISTELALHAAETYHGTIDSIFIPIHVDCASGGFTLPFTQPTDTSWKFSSGAASTAGSAHVKSINVSMHKFGLTYPGLGCVVYADEDVVDPSLIYNITYLNSSFYDFNVNFSRGSAMVIAGYYNLIRNGTSGYAEVIKNCYENALYLATQIQNPDVVGTNRFTVISDNDKFPWVVFKDELQDTTGTWTMADLSLELEKANWECPQYQLPDNSSASPDGPNAMRVVVRQNISRNKLNLLLSDIKDAIAHLEGVSFDYADPKVQEVLAPERERKTFKGPIGC